MHYHSYYPLMESEIKYLKSKSSHIMEAASNYLEADTDIATLPMMSYLFSRSVEVAELLAKCKYDRFIEIIGYTPGT